MSKGTNDKDRINRLLKKFGVHFSSKTYRNIRTFLEMYREIRRDLKNIPKSVGDAVIRKSAPELFQAMIEAEDISRGRVGDFVEELMSYGWLENYIEATLDEVRSFSLDGETYYKILTGLYLGEKTYDASIVEEDTGYCHSTFQNKKRHAVMLFGVLFWKRMLDHWDNSIVEMEKIERQEGRDGSLTERRRSEEDRRSGVRDRRKGDRRVLGDRRMAPSGCL